ncbi:MAG: DUF2812 domain-containing protein [Oscillospiraceae bacterium]
MSEHKWGFFPFDAMDYKAAQAYLDKKADAGWVLDKLSCKWFARFVPAGGRSHYVDLDLHGVLDDGPDADYLQLCEDAGWELIKRTRGMLLFRSLPGKHPVPLQTDAGMEADRFWKKYVLKNFLWLLVLLLIFVPLYVYLFSMPGGGTKISTFFCSNAVLLLLLWIIFAAVYLVWSFCFTLGSYIRFRRLGRLPERGRPGAWLMGVLGFIMAVLLVGWWCLDMAETVGLGETVDVAWNISESTATPELCQSYPVITAADLGLPSSKDSRYLDGRRSLLTDFLDYSEITPGTARSHILTTERYDCAGEALARLLFSLRREETANGQFTWGELDWGETTSDWGFDQVCTARDGSYLLLREDDIVVLVGAEGLDLTAPEYLDTLRQRLFADP